MRFNRQLVDRWLKVLEKVTVLVVFCIMVKQSFAFLPPFCTAQVQTHPVETLCQHGPQQLLLLQPEPGPEACKVLYGGP